MADFNDCRRDYFKNQQTLYSDNLQDTRDYEAAALIEALNTSFPIVIEDSWRTYFGEYGLSDTETKPLDQLWREYLTDVGFDSKDSLTEDMKDFFCSGSVDLALIPNINELIQWTMKEDIFQDSETDLWYWPDSKGDQLRTVHKGSYGDFNGTDNSIEFGNILDTTEPYIKIVFRQDTLVRQCVFSKGINTGSSTDFAVQFLSANSDINFIGYAAGGSLAFNIDADLAEYFEEFVECEFYVKDGTAYIKVNGTVVASDTVSAPIRVSTNELLLGTRGYADWFAGDVSYMELKDNLTEVGEYDFEEASGTVLYDKSGNRNDGTIAGTMTDFWQESCEVKSYKNENGYNLGSVGDELNDDVNFEVEENWSFQQPSYWSFLDPGFRLDNDGTFSKLTRDFGLTVGRTYRLTATVTDYVTGSWRFRLGSNSTVITTFSGNGTFTADLYHDGTTSPELASIERNNVGGNEMTFTSFSVKEVIPDTVYVPRLETTANTDKAITQQTDILNQTLDQYGRARLDIQAVENSVLDFNGTNNDIILSSDPVLGTTDFVFQSEVTPNVGGAIIGIIGGEFGSFGVDINTSGNVRIILSGLTSVYTSTATVSDGEKVLIKYERNYSGTSVLTIGDITENVTDATDYYGITNTIGSRFSSLWFDGKIFNSKIDNIYNLVFGEGSGDKVYDKITGDSFTINGTLTDVWTTDDTQRPNNLIDGFSPMVGNDGNANWIDTEFIPDNKTRVEIGFKVDVYDAQDKIFGTRAGTNYFFFGISGPNFYGIANTNTADIGYFGSYNEDYNEIVFDAKNGFVKINDGPEEALVVNNFTIAESMYLFGERGASNPVDGKMAYCKIYDDDVLVRDYVPEIGVGLVDRLTGKVYANAGTGTGFTFPRIPANEDGTDDVLGIGLTNPGTTKGHNNAETKMLQPMAPELYAVPLANAFNGVDDGVVLPNSGIKTGNIVEFEYEAIYNDYDTSVGVSAMYNLDGVFQTRGCDTSINGTTNTLIMSGFYSGGSIAFVIDIVSFFGSKAAFIGTKHKYLVHYEPGNNYFLIDGVLADSDTNTNEVVETSGSLFIGCRSVTSTQRYVDGAILRFKTANLDLVPIKKGDTLGTQTATANGMYDSVNDDIYYTSGAGELDVYNGLMFSQDCTAVPYGWGVMETNYNDLGYWFVDDNRSMPVKKTSVLYGTQQTGDDLAKAIKFVGGN